MADPLKIYKALADETRLRLLRLLGRGALNVNELIGILNMGQSRISRHLKILAESELVVNRREGTWIYYQWNEGSTPLVSDTLAHLQRHEQSLPHYTEDLQHLEVLIERRKEQTRTFFDSVTDPHKDLHHQCLDGDYYRQVALSLLPQHSPVVLDLGTGTGLLIPGLLQQADQVIAVDSSTTMLELARQNANSQVGRADFRLGDLEHLPVADGEADSAIACMVLHHLSNPSRVLAEAYRALKPGGHIAIVDLHQHDDESLRDSQADLWLGFKPDAVRGWLEKSHFDVIDTAIVGEPQSLKLITFKGKKP